MIPCRFKMRIGVVFLLAAQALLSVAAAPSATTPLALERRATTATACTANAQCSPTASKYCPTATSAGAKRACQTKVADAKACTTNAACLMGLCQANGKCESTNLATAKKCSTNVSASYLAFTAIASLTPVFRAGQLPVTTMLVWLVQGQGLERSHLRSQRQLRLKLLQHKDKEMCHRSRHYKLYKDYHGHQQDYHVH